MESPVRLTGKKRLFAEFWLQSRNQTQAAIHAGYSAKSAHVTGHRLLKNAKVLAYIEEREKELIMSTNEILMRLTRHGRGDMAAFIGKTPNELKTHPQSDLIKEFEHTITGVGLTREEKIKLKLYDAQAAMFHMWKHHQIAAGKATESVDVTDAKQRLEQLIARQADTSETGDDPEPTE